MTISISIAKEKANMKEMQWVQARGRCLSMKLSKASFCLLFVNKYEVLVYGVKKLNGLKSVFLFFCFLILESDVIVHSLQVYSLVAAKINSIQHKKVNVCQIQELLGIVPKEDDGFQ